MGSLLIKNRVVDGWIMASMRSLLASCGTTRPCKTEPVHSTSASETRSKSKTHQGASLRLGFVRAYHALSFIMSSHQNTLAKKPLPLLCIKASTKNICQRKLSLTLFRKSSSDLSLVLESLRRVTKSLANING